MGINETGGIAEREDPAAEIAANDIGIAAKTEGGADSGDMALINKLARRRLEESEVYIFPVTLCDNETDRDCERFSVGALKKLSELFVGRTGIFDHDPSGKNQAARIFKAELATDPDKTTRSGEQYTFVRAKAYMMRTEGNEDLIREIDGGIKKEVSVSCAVGRRVCSICGADERSGECSHIKGKSYGGRLCEKILDEPTDAYEWSFVAVPAQPAAGITKSLGGYSRENCGEQTELVKSLRRELDERSCEIERARADVISETIRLGQFCVPAYDPDTVRGLCKQMDFGQLIEFKERTRKQVRREKCASVLDRGESEQPERQGFGGFKLRK